jgi:hypothetical protein
MFSARAAGSWIVAVLAAAFCAAGTKCAAADLAAGAVKKNADPVGRYEKLELTAPLTGLECRNPYDPGEVDLTAEFTAPSGKKWSVCGFYAPDKTRDFKDPDGWRVRFAANETGQWKGVVIVKNKERETRSEEFAFACADSSHHGWIRVSKKDPHYFAHDDGTPWYGIGHCDHGRFGNDIPLEEYPKHGLNAFVHWAMVAHPIESEGEQTENTGVGVYDQTSCRWIDDLLERCEEHDVKFICPLRSHSDFYNRWKAHGWSQGRIRNAYHRLRGGKLPAGEWASDPESLAYQDRFHRYVIARWGYSRALGMWDLLVEVNLARQKNVQAWVKRTHEFFAKNDPFRHPTSLGGSGGQWLPWAYRIVDAPNYHSYAEGQLDKLVGILVKRTRDMRGFGRPNYVGEYGTSNPKIRLEYMHRSSWACTAAGAALTPLYWLHEHDRYYRDQAGMPAAEYLKHQGILAEFVKDIPFGVEKLTPIPRKDMTIADGEKAEPAAPGKPFNTEIKTILKWGTKHPPPPVVLNGPEPSGAATGVAGDIMGGAHGDLKSPLAFGVKCAGDSKMTFRVLATSKAGSRLCVVVDGRKAFEKAFEHDPKRLKGEWTVMVEKEFTVDLPAGVHAVRMENSGRDWVRIDRYRFQNLLEPTQEDMAEMRTRAAGTGQSDPMLGMRGKGFAFLYIMEPAFARGRKLSIANMPDGIYGIEWWNTWTGKVILKEEVKTDGGALLLRVPESERDIACKMRKMR